MPMGVPPDPSSVAFVSPTPMTVAALLAGFPAGATYLGKYARVNDLYGSADEVMRCSKTGASTYYWRPQRSDYAQNSAQTGGAMSLIPLVTPPQLKLTATLASSMTITPSATNAWPGCCFDVTMAGVLGIFGITIAGLIGVSVPLLSGATKRIIYDGSGYYTE